MSRTRIVASLLWGTVLLAGGCGSDAVMNEGIDQHLSPLADAAQGNAADASTIAPDLLSPLDASILPDLTAPAGPTIYAASPSTLYAIDPVQLTATTVGDFQGCGMNAVNDIAVDKNGALFATSFTSFFSVDPKTAVCTHIGDGGYPNSLSFVPQGTLDPNQEALVGFADANYIRIDVKTGAITPIGTLGGGYVSSGDVVSVIGGPTYLAATGPNCADCIVEVDPKTGALVKALGPIGYSAVYGVAFWAGKIYGFDANGDVFTVDRTSGAGTLVTVANLPAKIVFYGGASTTAAPLQ